MPTIHPTPPNICERTMDYSLRAISLFDYLQQIQNRAGWVIANQFLRASTAIGANIEEAQAGESRADFAHKCAISLKESRESLYWLNLLHHAKIVSSDRLTPLIQETKELVAILTTIVKKSKRPLNLPSFLFSFFNFLF